VGRRDAAALGTRWAITTVAGTAVDEQFSVFGSSGTVVFAAISGLLLQLLVPIRSHQEVLA
jgi:hypothetical protein